MAATWRVGSPVADVVCGRHDFADKASYDGALCLVPCVLCRHDERVCARVPHTCCA